MKLFVASSSLVAKPLISTLLAGKDHQLLGLITNPDKATGRGMQIEANELATWAQSEKIQTYKPSTHDEIRLIIEKDKPDLVITIAYGQLIPEPLLDLPKHGWINVHFSTLPKWRGAAPVQWAILNGDKESGISIFKLERGMDTGPIYLMQSIQIESSERSEELLERLSILGSSLTLDSLTLISDGFTPQAQSAQGVSIAPKFKKSDGQLDWSQSSEQIFNRYRALSDNPGVWSMLADLRIKIDSLRPSYASDQLKPGEILIDSEKFFVGTSTNVIEIVRLTPAGRNQMSAAEFIRGLPNRSGLSLG
ncbi:MAG: methionyl-tRNA formyltransferase [Candidatus Nanopelagicus sp.]|nr:methionyl-tRNA formyltransferase [Candidatus Nanopelagicus sp.]